MKGAALREEHFIDVGKLFAYVADVVPTLAANLGGVQRPLVVTPSGSSFDIGALNQQDRAQIPLFSTKQLVGRPLLLNQASVGDQLNLTSQWQTKLRQCSDAGSAWLWVDSDDYPDAYIPRGLYICDGERLTVRLTLWHDGVPMSLPTISGEKAHLPNLIAAMDRELTTAINSNTIVCRSAR